MRLADRYSTEFRDEVGSASWRILGMYRKAMLEAYDMGVAEGKRSEPFMTISSSGVRIGGLAGRPTSLECDFIEAQIECREIWRKKHADYGPEPIQATGERGIHVRVMDKILRLKRLLWGANPPCNESIEDTIMDMINYLTIWLLVRRGQWPGMPSGDLTRDSE